MKIVISLGLISIFFAWFESAGLLKHGLKFSFFIIFLFLALRFDYGNDYNSYFNYFSQIKYYGKIDFFNPSYFDSDYGGIEVGWLALNSIFRFFGFFTMIAAIALFNCIVYYRFIKKFVPPSYYWLAVFLYIFSPYIMLIQLSAMRQSMAITFFILSLDFLVKRKIIHYYIVVFIAICFHTSALILIPIYFIRFTRVSVKNIHIIITITVYIILLLGIGFFTTSLGNLSKFLFSRYSVYLETQNVAVGFTALFSGFIIFIILKSINNQNNAIRYIYILLLIGFFLIPVGNIFAMSARLFFYFQVFTIAVYPIIVYTWKNRAFKILFTGLIIFVTLFAFHTFFQFDNFGKHYMIYQTIFDAPKYLL